MDDEAWLAEMADAWRDANEDVHFIAREDAASMGMDDEQWLRGHDRQRLRQLKSVFSDVLFPGLARELRGQWQKMGISYGTERYFAATNRYYWLVCGRYEVTRIDGGRWDGVHYQRDGSEKWRVEDPRTGLFRDFETEELFMMVETIMKCAASCEQGDEQRWRERWSTSWMEDE